MSADDQFWGGDTATNDAYVGKPRTFTIDTETPSIRLHDGVTPGGYAFGGGGAIELYQGAFPAGLTTMALSFVDDGSGARRMRISIPD